MSELDIRQDGRTTIFTLNRPDKRNTINVGIAKALAEGFAAFDASEQRVAIITGEGAEFFCGGADLEDAPQLWRAMPTVGLVTEKPVIAAINGRCVGGAVALVAFCDLCVAADTAVFYYPEARVGVCRGLIATLATRIPHKFAMEIILMARDISAQRAYEMGLVNQVVPPGEQLNAALEIARDLEQMAPLVHQTMKRFITDHVLTLSPVEVFARTERDIDVITQSRDRVEGMTARREKRPPVFTGQ